MSEFGTLYTPPYAVKVDTLRTCAAIYIVELGHG